MQSPVNATRLRLDIQRPKRSFEVLSCKGAEPFNRPYFFELQIITEQGPLDAHEFLFSAGFLHPHPRQPCIHGHIQSIVRSSGGSGQSQSPGQAPIRYDITFGPRLGLMAFRHNRRIFQGMCARAIIAQLLHEHGIADGLYLWQRAQPCATRDYCAQYFESDLQLLQRLCEEEGVHYRFEHSPKRHVVIFVDAPPDRPSAQPPRASSRSRGNAAGKTASPLRRRATLQRACVAGELFSLATHDEKGRIKVRFEWGHQGEGARFNDCWIVLADHLDRRPEQWWGGMEVVVDFVDGDPDRPYISDRLWDPDINPQTCPDPDASRRMITTRINPSMLMGDTNEVSVDDRLVVRMAEHSEMRFRVGNSEVTIDSKSISLSGLRIMLTSIADAAERRNDHTPFPGSGAGPC